MQLRRLVILAIVVTSAALLAAGCGDEAIGEKLAEEAIESAGNGDVDVDVDGDDVTIESKEGNASFSTNGELPDGWPSDIELPDGTKIAGSTAIDVNEGRQLSVNGAVDATPDEVFEHVEGQLDGWEQTTKSDIGSGEDTFVNATWERDGDAVTLNASSSAGNDETTFMIGYTLRD